MIEAYSTVVNYLPQLDRKETKTNSKPNDGPINSPKLTDKVKKKAKSGESTTRKGQKPKYNRKKSSFKTVLVDFNVNGTCDAVMERFTNAFSFANLGLALQCWNVKPLVGNILYVGSDGLSVLFQWVPDQKRKLFATISGTQRLQQVVGRNEIVNNFSEYRTYRCSV